MKEKFKNNVVLTRGECSLLIALPLFELIQSESEVVKEICYLIGNKILKSQKVSNSKHATR